MRDFIAGANFLRPQRRTDARLRERAVVLRRPYAEGALSGLSSTVADEIAIYRAAQPAHAEFAPLDFAAFAARKPPTLSGGEQVLLALHCFSRSDYNAIGYRHRARTARPGRTATRRWHICRAEIFPLR
jgi:hypothetical protein